MASDYVPSGTTIERRLAQSAQGRVARTRGVAANVRGLRRVRFGV
jgi:hypothetical protein